VTLNIEDRNKSLELINGALDKPDSYKWYLTSKLTTMKFSGTFENKIRPNSPLNDSENSKRVNSDTFTAWQHFVVALMRVA
jgi:hypothetical protein